MAAVTTLKLGAVRPSSNGSLYRQIAETLTKKIARGKLATGTRLPPERELAKTLRVNRLTLRQALQDLELQGRLTRRHGSGWYVAEPVIERQAGKLFSFTNRLQNRGYALRAKLVRCVKHHPDEYIASQLRLRSDTPVYDLHRLRFINDEPVALERYIFSTERFPNLETHDLEHRSILFDVLEREYQVSIVSAKQSLEPVIAGRYEAKLLAVKVGAPLMLEKRLSFDQNGCPVEYGSDLYRGDRFRFVTDMAALDL